MTFLVDANVLSEATKPDPDPRVVDWLSRHEREIAVNPIILGEILFGILLLPKGKRRARLERWFKDGVERIYRLAWIRPRACAGQSCELAADPCRSRTV